ncbi:MAG: sialate O-acetylesterase [Agriterribacter sp.]
MKKTYLLYLLCFIVCVSVNVKAQNCPGYDVFLVAGQSNTHYGYQLDTAKDTVAAKVYALKRYDAKDYRIEKAAPALDFWTKAIDRNSFAITFANLYAKNMLANSERKVLIIPAAYAGSSIAFWEKGASLFTDAMSRTNYVLDNIPGSKVVAILWHQGEANVGSPDYQQTLDQMISDMRNEIHQSDTANLKFILGGFVPFWANADSSRAAINTIIKNTPSRVPFTGFADPTVPFVITKPNNYFDDIHFDSDGQREMGKRYYEEFVSLNNNASGRKIMPGMNSNTVLMQNAGVKYFPNPASGIVNVIAEENIVAVEVYSTLSKVLEIKPSELSKKLTVDLNKQPAGTYFVNCLTTDGKVNRFKILRL